MSNNADNSFDLDLHFLPAWAQESATVNPYANFDGVTEEPGSRRRQNRPDRPPGRRGGPERAGRPPGSPRGEQEGRFRGRYEGGGQGRFRDHGHAPRPEVPPPDLDVIIQPESKGAEALARQIKQTGRAYPLFDIAHLVLKKPERYVLTFNVRKKADGQVAQPLFLCNLDDTLWLTEQEAIDHVLQRHFATFYQTEKIPTEPPKGRYTFVAQCGMSGIILGPPNYHDYQTKLLRLHAERFSRMPFDVYKSRVRIVRDEAVVKQWLEDQSFRTEYICLNVPETIKFQTREEVERHFREVHMPVVIQSIESYTISSIAARSLPCRRLQAAVRRTLDEQRRFPLKVVNALSHQFASLGLHFFKVNKSVTHVSAARPRYLDLNSTVVSEGVRTLMQFIDAHPRTNRRQLIEALAPTTVAPAPEIRQTPAVQESKPVADTEPQQAPPADTAQTAAPTPEAPAAPPPPSPEVAALLGDLHWLMHEGHVIEFANGILETAKKPAPRPPKAATPQKTAASTDGSVAEVTEETPQIAAPENAPTSAQLGEGPAEESTTSDSPTEFSQLSESSTASVPSETLSSVPNIPEKQESEPPPAP
ncbi:MAG TPA: hypothetical protein P5186_07460 [Candidatus Paceibacterota bacterium]|nr:hypothetical protein [Candidatus Paceibacterota bacterium]